ncbi:MAG TPA: DnaJ domain-containing protein [Acidimicrobiales bacterium]
MKQRDHYEVLGVSRTASVDEMHDAYRRLARKLHPDLGTEPDDEAMRLVNEAWDVLENPARRAAYDRTFGPVEEPPAAWDGLSGSRPLPPIPPGFCLYPRPRHRYSPHASFRRLEDERRGALSLEALTTDLSPLLSLRDDQLWTFAVNHLPVTDRHLAVLARFSRLEVVDLSDTKVSDRGLLHLSGLRRLREVVLAGCAVTDAGAATLAVIRSLDTLNLYGTRVTDEGMAALARLPRLSLLDIRHTRVTGAALEVLAKIPTLKELRVTGMRRKYRRAFEEERPDVRFIH